MSLKTEGIYKRSSVCRLSFFQDRPLSTISPFFFVTVNSQFIEILTNSYSLLLIASIRLLILVFEFFSWNVLWNVIDRKNQFWLEKNYFQFKTEIFDLELEILFLRSKWIFLIEKISVFDRKERTLSNPHIFFDQKIDFDSEKIILSFRSKISILILK